MAAGIFDLEVTPSERYDIYFDLQAPVGVALPLSGWTAVAQIIANWTPIAVSAGTDPEIDLVQEPGSVTGRVALTLGADLTGSFLAPISGDAGMLWRLDLVDNADTDNLVPVLKGAVKLEAPW